MDISQKKTYKANKYMKTCPTLLAIRKIANENHNEITSYCSQNAKIKKTKNIDDHIENNSLVYSVKNVSCRDGSVSENACCTTTRTWIQIPRTQACCCPFIALTLGPGTGAETARS